MIAGVDHISHLERIFHVQGDPRKHVAQSVLESESHHRRDYRSAGQHGFDLEIENRVDGHQEENEVQDDGDDPAQELRGSDVATAGKEDVEDERVDRSYDEEDERGDGAEENDVQVLAEDVLAHIDAPDHERLVVENREEAVQSCAQQERNIETRAISVADALLLTLLAIRPGGPARCG